ncbi:MAG TPA: SCO family protein [Pseudogracilibacillus sp.]|nr:SCO family protein [Pseudogracilibacillus sp.]
MRKFMFLLLALPLLVLAACGGDGETNPINEESNKGGGNGSADSGQSIGHVEPFEATTQENEPFTNEDLDGTWWVANFIFTNCETVCLPMTSNMKALQDKLNDAGIEDVELISFSVDPERDTPEVMKEFAEEYGADFSNWTFLTGYEFDEIKELSLNSFKSLVAPPPEDDDQIAHGTAFFIVNPEGEVLSHHSGLEADSMDEIAAELERLK